MLCIMCCISHKKKTQNDNKMERNLGIHTCNLITYKHKAYVTDAWCAGALVALTLVVFFFGTLAFFFLGLSVALGLLGVREDRLGVREDRLEV